MSRVKRQEKKVSSGTTNIPSNILIKMNINNKVGRYLNIIWVSNDEYELLDDRKIFVVHLNKGKYEYGSWQMQGIPYKHVMTAINQMG